MGFLKRVKEEVEAPPKPPKLPLPDDCVWTAWAEKAGELLGDRNLVTAVDCWVRAVACFDGKPKLFEKLHDEIFSGVSEYLVREAIEGRVISSHKFAEIDMEYLKKESVMRVSLLSEDVFYYAKEHLSDALSAEEAAMVFISGAYSYLGLFRFATDLGDVSDKCREVCRFGDYAVGHCGSFPSRGYRGKVKPATAIGFIGSVCDFYRCMADRIDGKLAVMNETQIQWVTEKRLGTREDLNGVLGDALQYCIQSTGSKPIRSEKVKNTLLELIDRYIEEFVRTV